MTVTRAPEPPRRQVDRDRTAAALKGGPEVEAVHGSHHGLAGVMFSNLAQRRCVISVHVLDDSHCCLGQWIGFGGRVLFSGDPSHYAEAPNEVHSRDLQPVKAKSE